MDLHRLLQKTFSGWSPVVAIGTTTVASIAVAVYCLSFGWYIIFQNLFYVPITIACMYYKKKGFAFSVLVALIYLMLMLAFNRTAGVIGEAAVRVVIFIAVAGVVTVLMIRRGQAEERLRASEAHLAIERQMQDTQRLESLGALAGGVAHDFNNILTSILGNAELALSEIAPSAPARANLLEVVAASQRAAALCRQMLAYSGRSRFVIGPIDAGAFIESMLPLLRSAASKKVSLSLDLEKELPVVQGDPSQLSQLIMNLVSNASEAIGEEEGIITISAGAREFSGEYLKEIFGSEKASPGLYLCLEVADTGCGMESRTLERLFEPFFTTKFTGRGLGLPAAQGIVRGHKGAIQVQSEVGRGTTVSVLLPALAAESGELLRKNNPTEDEWQGEGTILLVDDEETVRTMGARALAALGFAVIAACDGHQALEVYREHRDEIALVLLDLTMPRMDGEEALCELRLIDPEVRVVMSSGYTESDVVARLAGKGVAGFLQKPYALAELREKLRVALTP